MKTVKELAEELNVSKPAVMKKIDNLGLRSSLRKIANQFAIDEEQETLIKSAFEQKKSPTANRQPVCDKTPTFSDVVCSLERQLEAKDRQIAAKDKQIESLQKELETAQQIIIQAQQLHAISEQKMKLLEEKSEEQKKSWWKFWK